MPQLTDFQRNELILQFAELVVGRMDKECLMQIAEDHITEYCEDLSDADLREEINNEQDGLYEELVDDVKNVTVLDSFETASGERVSLVDYGDLRPAGLPVEK